MTQYNINLHPILKESADYDEVKKRMWTYE